MDLSTRYLGLNLPNPIVPSASPLSRTLDGILRLDEAVKLFPQLDELVTVRTPGIAESFAALGTALRIPAQGRQARG